METGGCSGCAGGQERRDPLGQPQTIEARQNDLVGEAVSQHGANDRRRDGSLKTPAASQKCRHHAGQRGGGGGRQGYPGEPLAQADRGGDDQAGQSQSGQGANCIINFGPAGSEHRVFGGDGEAGKQGKCRIGGRT